MKHRRKTKPVHLRNPYDEESAEEATSGGRCEEAGIPVASA